MPAHNSEIHAFIRSQIVSGHLKPGDMIDETALSDRFNVSKTPIREAILQLEAASVLERRPRAGAYVATLNINAMIELIEMHSELEGAAAYHAARRGTPAQIRALQRAGDAYETAVNAQASDVYDRNLAFHMAVFAACNNMTLQREIDATGVRLVAYFRAQEGVRTGQGRALAEHSAIFAAIRDGRADDARAAMRRHAEIASDTLLDVLALMRG